jgi:bacterial/archaeal transporter family-2 protein
MGATTLMALVVAGQIFASVAVDHFGVFGFEIRSATMVRLAGCALLMSGFILIVKS